MTSNIDQFETDMQISLGKAKDFAHGAVREALEQGFSYIMDEWPVWTGWSGANNWVRKTSPVTTPEPDQRPTHKGAMAEDVGYRFLEGLQEIGSIEFNKTRGTNIFITNPVPYASTYAQGEPLYQTAAEMMEAIIELSFSSPEDFG